MGNVISSGLGQAPAKQAAMLLVVIKHPALQLIKFVHQV